MATERRPGRGLSEETSVGELVRWGIERAVLLLLVAFFTFPILWMLLTSLKTRVQAFAYPPVWVFTPTFDAYVQVLLQEDLLLHIVNSFVVAVGNTALVLAVSAPAAYSMARYDTGGENALMYVLSIRFLPPIVVIPALFVEMKFLGLVNTRLVLVLLYSLFNIPFAVWLLRAAFQKLPQDLIDATRMDGASEFEIFYYVALPMIKPVLFAAAIISFIFSWNEFLFALVFTTGGVTTAPVEITGLVTGREVFWNQIMAGGVLMSIPLAVLAYTSQQYIIRGLTFGATE
jgi:multiple sugar transport system permease protein